MFWDRVAGVYDVFVHIINGKTHRELRKIVADLIRPGDTVLECACGTGLLTAVIAGKCRDERRSRGMADCQRLSCAVHVC